MKPGQYIKKLRTDRGLTQEELGKIAGVKRAAVQKWESGTVNNFKKSTIQKLSDYFNVAPSAFIEGATAKELKVPDTYEYAEFPVLGEKEKSTITIPRAYLKGRKKSDFFVIGVCGDSMYPEYHAGDKVLVLRQNALDFSGQVGAVVCGKNENATLKRVEFKPGENWMNLVPINPNHPPKRIDKENMKHCKVLGVPKMLIRELD